MNNKINWLVLGFALANLHFGLGFVMGTGEDVYLFGATGALYAISSGLGLLCLSVIAPYYWKFQLPVWDLFNKNYGRIPYLLSANLSWMWMVGIIAAQLVCGKAILSIYGINQYLIVAILAIIICVLAMVKIQKIAIIFTYSLFISILLFIFALYCVGFESIGNSFTSLIDDIPSINFSDYINIAVTTVLITIMGMDFQQFIIKAKNGRQAQLGSVLGGIILIMMALIIMSVVIGAINGGYLNNISDAKMVIPEIIKSIGDKYWGLLMLPFVLISISGAGLLRVVVSTIITIKNHAKENDRNKYTILLMLLSIVIALCGKTIIELITIFYALYVGVVTMPFILMIIEKKKKKRIVNIQTVNKTMIVTSISLIVLLIFSLVGYKIISAGMIMLTGIFLSSIMLTFEWKMRKI